MFFLSRRAGQLADRFGPRWFMGFGPLVAAAGLALLQRVNADVDYVTDLLPAILLFALGLAATVAPLTATVLADADEHNAGIASGVNNAIARVAGLLAVAALGAVVAAQFTATIDDNLAARSLSPEATRKVDEAKSRTMSTVDPNGLPPAERAPVAQAVQDASVTAFHRGVGIAAALVALGGVLGIVGIRNPRREVPCAECPGGVFAGAPLEVARARQPAHAAT
jgi:MFS family permease